MTTAASSSGYTWDWRNRMTQSGNGHSTTTYAYDDNDSRASQTTGNTTTFYPNKYDSVTASSTQSTTTDYIYLPDGTLLAAVDESGLSTTTRYMHNDYLGSTNVVTNASGTPTQTLAYMPYGSWGISSSSPITRSLAHAGQSPRNFRTRICIREMENRVALDPWPLTGIGVFRQAQR